MGGIYYVFFTAHGGHQMRIYVDAPSRVEAVKIAEAQAKKMQFGWKYSHTEACR